MNTFHVSVSGNDSWDGSEERPFSTVRRAVRAVRECTASGDRRIVIHEGTYHIYETIWIEGTDNLVIEGVGRPLLSSMVELAGFERSDRKNVFRCTVSDACLPVKTVFHGHDMVERCHGEFFPNQEKIEYQAADSLNVVREEDRILLRRIKLPEGMYQSFENPEHVEFRFMPVPWTMNIRGIESYDEKENVVYTDEEATAPVFAKSFGIRAENDKSLLTPDTFCSIGNEIYYMSSDGRAPEGLRVPAGDVMFHIENCSNVVFRNLAFEGGRRYDPPKGYKGTGIQHDWEFYDSPSALIRFRNDDDCGLDNVLVRDTGRTAVRLDQHCQKCFVRNSMFDDIGHMGIFLCGYGPGLKYEHRHNFIENNIITRVGQEIWHGPAIFLWQSGENLISHNTIHDCPRKAIGVSGVRVTVLLHPEHRFDEAVKSIRWDEIRQPEEGEDEFECFMPYLHSKDNIVQYNNIYRVLSKIGDGAACNTSGAGRGNVIDHNYIHHISTHRATACFRVDDWQCGTLFTNNVTYMTNVIGITRKNFNHVINNIFCDANRDTGYLKFASYPGEKPQYGSLIQKNIFLETDGSARFFSKGYLVSEGATLEKHCHIGSNVYWSDKPEDIRDELDGRNERNSVVMDPHLVDVGNQDFRLREDSPCRDMGIESIDVSLCGVTDDYPQDLREIEYDVPDTSVYDRRNQKDSYEWW